MEQLSLYIGWAVGIAGGIAFFLSQYRNSMLESKKDYRDQAQRLIAVKDEILLAKEEQNSRLESENSALRKESFHITLALLFQ